MRPAPASKVAAWIAERDAEAFFLTAASEAEQLYGVAIKPAGRRRDTLEASLTRWLDLGFDERFLPFDSAAARDYAEIAAERRRAGRRSRLPVCRHIPLARCCHGHAQRAGFREYGRQCRRSLVGCADMTWATVYAHPFLSFEHCCLYRRLTSDRRSVRCALVGSAAGPALMRPS